MIFHLLTRGILVGLGISFLIGPSFFALFQTSIQRGPKYGIVMAAGILLSDITLVFLSLGGLSFLGLDEHKIFSGVLAGIIITLYGVYCFLNKRKDPYLTNIDDTAPYVKRANTFTNTITKYFGPDSKWPVYFVKGFSINLLNPFLWVFWATSVSVIGVTADKNEIMNALVFLSGVFVTTFSFDVLKVFLGYKVKKILTYKRLIVIDKILGVILMIFGVALIIRVVL